MKRCPSSGSGSSHWAPFWSRLKKIWPAPRKRCPWPLKRKKAHRDDRVKKEQLLKQVEGELAVYAEYEREEKNVSRIRELSEALDKAGEEQQARRQHSQ